MWRVLAVVLFFAAVLPANAQPFYKHKQFWGGLAAIGASVGTDTFSTCRGFANGYSEGTFATRGNRSCGVAIGMAIGAFSFYTTMDALEWHVTQDDPNRFIRFTGRWAIPAIAVPIHSQAAVHNFNLPGPSPPPVSPLMKEGLIKP